MGFDLASIFGKGVKEAVTSIGDIADKFITTKQEKEEFQAKIEEVLLNASQKELDSYLADTQSAREANTRIQESDKASWLSKNMAYIMDILVSVVWAGFTLYLGGRAINLIDKSTIDLTAVLSLYSTVTAVFMISMNFHRGTSRGSEKSGDALRQMVKDK